jgi:hypothetical protein
MCQEPSQVTRFNEQGACRAMNDSAFILIVLVTSAIIIIEFLQWLAKKEAAAHG